MFVNSSMSCESLWHDLCDDTGRAAGQSLALWQEAARRTSGVSLEALSWKLWQNQFYREDKLRKLKKYREFSKLRKLIEDIEGSISNYNQLFVQHILQN